MYVEYMHAFCNAGQRSLLWLVCFRAGTLLYPTTTLLYPAIVPYRPYIRPPNEQPLAAALYPERKAGSPLDSTS